MTSATSSSMDYNLFDYVLHKDKVCILVDFDDDKSTLLYIYFYENSGCFCTVEYNTTEEIKLYEEEVSPIMERLRAFRMCHDDAFGFVEEELSLVHYF